ncbi:MAG: histidinol-phosphate aminotransferase family protein [Chloroflexota bacterium]|nr:histidinol-phosphate aminotransferase family protein [Chloroflexota bacterium]
MPPHDPQKSEPKGKHRGSRQTEEADNRQYIRLHSDENPYGCSLRVQDILGSSDLYHLPADPVCLELRAALSDYTGFSPERIVAGVGTAELTERMLHAFLDAGDAVIACPPSLPQHNLGASRARVTLVQVPRNEQFDIDPDAIVTAMRRQTNIKMVVISSPNNPTGNLVSHNSIVQLLQAGVWVVVDETYFEFADRTAAPLVTEFDSLVVLRSFSPWAGLHGLPTGYALCSPRAASRLQRLSPTGGLNRAAQLAAIASLEDRESLMQRVRRLRLERGRLYRQLRKLNLLQPYVSSAPFLLCRMTRGNATQVQRHLQQRGVLVKSITDRWLSNHLRIGVGRPEDTNALIAGLKELAAEPYL